MIVNDKEHSIQFRLYLDNPSNAITPVLPTEEPEYSLSMGDEHLSTIPETESDELIKSSVENLVPISSESEVTSDNESDCDVPVKDESFPIFTTFSNLLFDCNDDFTSSDDESLSNEDISMENFKIYSSPLFDDEEIISRKIDTYHFVESDLIESLLNRDTLINSSPKFDYLLEEFSGELAHINSIPQGIEEADFDLEGNPNFCYNCRVSLSPSPIHVKDSDSQREEIELFLDTDDLMPLDSENNDYDSEGDIHILEELLSNDSLSLSENESSNFDHLDDPSFPRPPLEPPDVEVFFEPDSGVLTTKVVKGISEHYVLMPNILPTLPTFDPLYPVYDTLLLFSSKNEDKIFVRDKMSRDVITVGSTMRILLLYRGEYSQWRERFMNYLEEQTDGLPNDIYSLIDSNETAKYLWDALKRHMRGSEYGEQDRKTTILYEYETFKANEGEKLLDTYLNYLQVINDLKKSGYKKDNCELNYKFLNNLQPEWKQYGDVNDALGYKKKAVVVTSDPLALVAEKTKMSKRKEKVVVSSDSEGSGADDFSKLKKNTALLAKAFNRGKLYSKPTNNNLRTSSTSQSANKKQEFVKSDDKKQDKKADEKKRDMRKVKCYNCKKEGYFAKDCKNAKEINANMVFMAQIKKVLLESDESSSSAKETIAEKRIETANQQSKDLENQNKDLQEKYGVLLNQVNTFEEQNNGFNEQLKVLNEKNADLLAQTEVLQDQLKVKHIVIDTHTECQEQYAKLEEERYEYMIRYSALCDNDKQHRKKIDEQEILFDKMSRQLVEMNNNVLRLQEKILKKDTKISELEGCVSNKDVEIEKCLERMNECENKLHKIGQTNQTIHMIMPSKDTLYNGRKALEIKKFKRARENKIEFAYDYRNLNASYVNEKIIFSDDYFQEIINPYFEKIDSPFRQISSLKPYVPNMILEKIIIDLKDEVSLKLNKNVKRYSRKDLLSCNNSHLGETSSAYVCNDAMNVSCNSRMCDLFDGNNLFIFDDKSVRISPVSMMPFRKKPRDCLNVHSKSNSNKSLPRTVHVWLPKMKPLAEPVAKWIPRVKQSEYVAVSSYCAQVLWMRTQLTDYGFFYDKVPIYCDSKSAVAISCNPVQHTRTNHIDVSGNERDLETWFSDEDVDKGIYVEWHDDPYHLVDEPRETNDMFVELDQVIEAQDAFDGDDGEQVVYNEDVIPNEVYDTMAAQGGVFSVDDGDVISDEVYDAMVAQEGVFSTNNEDVIPTKVYDVMVAQEMLKDHTRSIKRGRKIKTFVQLNHANPVVAADGFTYEAEAIIGWSETQPKVYVAVGKDLKQSLLTLRWALHNSGGAQICILHVHQPAEKIPFMGTKVRISQLAEHHVKAHHEMERQDMLQLLDKYKQMCQRTGVFAEVHHLEMGCIEKGIADFILEHNVRRLVMGAAADKYYSRKMVDLRSSKAIYVRSHAATSCQIQFVCKGNIVFTSQGRFDGPVVSIPSPSLASSDTNSGSGQSSMRSSSVSDMKCNHLQPIDPTQDYRRVAFEECGTRMSTSSPSSPTFSVELNAGRADDEWSLTSYLTSRISTGSSEVVDDLGRTSYAMSEVSKVESHKAAVPESKEKIGMNNELYNQLLEAMAEADNSRQDAFNEFIRRRKAEKDAIEAKCRVKALENLYADESRRRGQIDETLEKIKEDYENIKKELHVALQQKSYLESRISDFEHKVQELEHKIISANEISQNYKRERDDLQAECEVKDATRNFDPSLKIGEGGYGSIFKGTLRHMEVSIKILHSNSLQGPSEFQQEVNVLSKLRHPNLVTLIGACPDAWVIDGQVGFGLTKEVKCALDEKKLKNVLDPTAGDWPFMQAQQLAVLAINCCDVVRKNRPDLAPEAWRVLEPMRVACGLLN
uniref:RING-type E3 ubiquitin transferase n=1 Tax=Tanacetum cinerariifolium TaxID=118510 RepID=A0A6L2NZP2_TANCI|nr:U-box domain-containing protein kinase family protein [Tanacetum cinerariifolium]